MADAVHLIQLFYRRVYIGLVSEHDAAKQGTLPFPHEII